PVRRTVGSVAAPTDRRGGARVGGGGGCRGGWSLGCPVRLRFGVRGGSAGHGPPDHIQRRADGRSVAGPGSHCLSVPGSDGHRLGGRVGRFPGGGRADQRPLPQGRGRTDHHGGLGGRSDGCPPGQSDPARGEVQHL
ncbi:uncharacterized protein METZ01_LOCUS104340, partial [marine metagenome]